MIPSNAPAPILAPEIFEEPIAAIEIDASTHWATPAGLFLWAVCPGRAE